MNETMSKFGYPGTLIAEYRHWCVLLRPKQVSLGSLVLVSHSTETAFSNLEKGAFSELHRVVGDIETTLQALFRYEKINYLMLMMVDPHVHFHVIPRYPERKSWGDTVFFDHGWPGPPDLGRTNETGAKLNARLVVELREHWPQTTETA